MALTFGCTASSYGLAQSVSNTETAEIAEARDETGRMNEMRAYSKGTEVTEEVILDGTLPSAGEALTLGGISVLCTSVAKNESNTDFNKATISGRTADSATLTAYS